VKGRKEKGNLSKCPEEKGGRLPAGKRQMRSAVATKIFPYRPNERGTVFRPANDGAVSTLSLAKAKAIGKSL